MNRHIGSTHSEHMREIAKSDPGRAARIKVEFDRMELAWRLKKLREQQQLTQADLAEMIGSRQSAVARMEAGRFAPRLDVLARVGAALGHRVDVRLVPVPGAQADLPAAIAAGAFGRVPDRPMAARVLYKRVKNKKSKGRKGNKADLVAGTKADRTTR